MKTNLGLVAYAKKALQEKWGYVWGTFGQVLTEQLLRQKIRQYPKEVGGYENFIRNNWLNKKTVDCVGLIKSYLWHYDGKIKYNPAQDKSADMMFDLAKDRGPISTLPEIPGLCLWKPGHIGIYTGYGQVIEAHGTKYGVIQTPIEGSGSTAWTHWLKCPYISYASEYLKLEDVLKKIADDPEGWEQAIDSLVAAADSGFVDSIYKYLPLLIEKAYNH